MATTSSRLLRSGEPTPVSSDEGSEWREWDESLTKTKWKTKKERVDTGFAIISLSYRFISLEPTRRSHIPSRRYNVGEPRRRYRIIIGWQVTRASRALSLSLTLVPLSRYSFPLGDARVLIGQLSWAPNRCSRPDRRETSRDILCWLTSAGRYYSILLVDALFLTLCFGTARSNDSRNRHNDRRLYEKATCVYSWRQIHLFVNGKGLQAEWGCLLKTEVSRDRGLLYTRRAENLFGEDI